MEPEADVVKIANGQSVLIELFGAEDPVIAITINQRGSHIDVAIWPSKGTYSLIEEES